MCPRNYNGVLQAEAHCKKKWDNAIMIQHEGLSLGWLILTMQINYHLNSLEILMLWFELLCQAIAMAELVCFIELHEHFERASWSKLVTSSSVWWANWHSQFFTCWWWASWLGVEERGTSRTSKTYVLDLIAMKNLLACGNLAALLIHLVQASEIRILLVDWNCQYDAKWDQKHVPSILF